MNLWRPNPMSCLAFGPFLGTFAVEHSDGQVTVYEAQDIGFTAHVPAHTDPQHRQWDLDQAINDISVKVTDALGRDGLVADVSEYAMDIRVTARVKAWPAVPGVTVAAPQIPMRDDAS